MIDINLLGKKPKSKSSPKLDMKFEASPKLIISFVAVVVLFLGYYFMEDIISWMNPAPQFQPIALENNTPPVQPVDTASAAPETTKVEPQPVRNDPTPPAPAWDYGLSLNHVDVYLNIASSLPAGIDYNVIAVSGNRLITELISPDAQNLTAVRSAIDQSLTRYTLNHKTENNVLSSWGRLKADAQMPVLTPSPDFASPQAVLQEVNTLAAIHKVRIQSSDVSDQFSRDNLTVIPGWIKFSGSQTNIMAFLTEIRDKLLSINITRVSAASINRRSNSNPEVHLTIQYELIL